MSTKTIWEMVEPSDTRFAHAWLRSPARLIGSVECNSCGRGGHYTFPKPLSIEWEPGSDFVGDFVWPGGGRVVARKEVCVELARTFGGLHAEDVEMVQDPKLKRPKKTNRTKPRVWLPYTGPELSEIWVEHTVPCLPITTTEVHSRCEVCGKETLVISGIEEKSHRWSQEKRDLVPFHSPRAPGMGLFVKSSEVAKAPIFRVDAFSLAILCTDGVKSYIEDRGFSNVDFLEVGSLV